MTGPKLNEPERPPFELIAGNVCLDFINTLDNRPSGQPKELLNDYFDLARFGYEGGILTAKQLKYFHKRDDLTSHEAEEVLRRARNFREALHEIFSAVMNEKTAPQSALDTLNENLRDAALHSRMIQLKGSIKLRFDDMTSSPNAILWPVARAAAELLASSDVAHVHACSSSTCLWFFLDTSKNHRRRWCDMKLCGNRDKVRRFYAKKRTA